MHLNDTFAAIPKSLGIIIIAYIIIQIDFNLKSHASYAYYTRLLTHRQAPYLH